jgi:flagellar basal body rod protein FlgF
LLLDKRYLVLLPREPPKTIKIQNLSSSELKNQNQTGFKQEIRKLKKINNKNRISKKYSIKTIKKHFDSVMDVMS